MGRELRSPLRAPGLAFALLLALSCAPDGGSAPLSPTPGSSSPAAGPSPRADASAPPGAPTSAPDGPGQPACADESRCYGSAQQVGTLPLPLLPEASGLAASVVAPGRWYLADDGPVAATVIWEGDDRVTALAWSGAEARDVEDLAVGPCPGGSCVYAADIGDNQGRRADVAVHRFVEPAPGAPLPEAVHVETARFTYPAGPRDAEALLVEDASAVLIVTKGPFDAETGIAPAPRLFRGKFPGGVLEDLGPVPLPEPAVALASAFVGNVVTAADAGPDRVLLLTYDSAFEYRAPAPGSPLAGFGAWPVTEVPAAPLVQPEALAWDPHGCGYRIAGEGVDELWAVACR